MIEIKEYEIAAIKVEDNTNESNSGWGCGVACSSGAACGTGCAPSVGAACGTGCHKQ